MTSAESEFDQLVVLTAMALDEATISLIGELDLGTAPSLAEALARVEAESVRCLIIDLAELDFIDSSGLQQLVVALKRQRDRGGDVVLRAPRPATLRVLEIVGLTQLFTIE